MEEYNIVMGRPCPSLKHPFSATYYIMVVPCILGRTFLTHPRLLATERLRDVKGLSAITDQQFNHGFQV